MKIDPLGMISSSPKINETLKKKIASKIIVIKSSVSEIEKMSGLDFPPYYLDPILTISLSTNDPGEIGILYARTVPVEINREVSILIQISAPLALFASKTALRLVLAHEFLHYLELIRQFASGKIISESSPSSIYEEEYEDSRRTIDPGKLFPKNRKLTKDLQNKFVAGFSDQKLNDKCEKFWIGKGLPTVKIHMGENQVRLSIEALANSSFDPKAVRLLTKLDANK